MPIEITAECELLIGQDTFLEGPSPDGPYVAVFEDNEETGYFYALDMSKEGQKIQDALHIYNVANEPDRTQPLTAKIGWSMDCQKVVLLIADHPQAVFDFSSKQGYCRKGFPPPPANGIWSAQGHEWREAALELFA